MPSWLADVPPLELGLEHEAGHGTRPRLATRTHGKPRPAPRYARATLSGGRFTAEEIDRNVASRRDRQAILERDRPPQLSPSDEAVLPRRKSLERIKEAAKSWMH
ncbi:Scr1 family TA system antitoxin-like transcriptional regulator [Micromonospora sp. NPDC049497]|uniref:Scr1 family TA system antitoxin-like transcriptional regulator n=1 Tax=Micromonospora sp. NPDC049497 TaxID=3364273 RepID=UPI0037B6107B